jgi:imidazolonepropionase-like amidohydrolase
MRRRAALFAILFCFAGFSSAQEPKRTATNVAVKVGRVLDVWAGAFLTDEIIWVEGDRIKAIGKTADISRQLPAGAKLIDLSGATVLPGLIDCHTHLTYSQYLQGLSGVRISYPRETLLGARNARVTHEAGFTTVRNVGAGGIRTSHFVMQSRLATYPGRA